MNSSSIAALSQVSFAIRAERFKVEVLERLEPARGTYIYDACVRDLVDKTSPDDPCGYRTWLSGLLQYLRESFGLHRLRILDLGCGNGEMTVLMNLMGFDATGLDINPNVLRLARILAEENGIAQDKFVLGQDGRLPFADGTFDVVVSISSLEHIDDRTLAWMVPELARICHGVVFVQVPSSMKTSDDHTGLKLVPWMPSWLATRYVALRGKRYRYLISDSREWDVVYRDLSRIERIFESYFAMSLVPERHSLPRCGQEDAVLDLVKTIRLRRFSLRLKVPLVHRRLRKALGMRVEHFLPYYNLVFSKR